MMRYGRAVQARVLASMLALLAGCAGEHEGTLGGVGFALRLPAGSRVAREESFPEMQYRRWVPASGDGLVVVVELHEGRGEPCGEPNPRAGRGGETVEGSYRSTSFSYSHCIDGGARTIRCACWHTRGYLEPSEVEPARATCASFRVVQ